MILLLGGTSDSRELTQYLLDRGLDICLSVVTPHGKQLASSLTDLQDREQDGQGTRFAGKLQIITGPLSDTSWQRLREELQLSLIIDATHPYATAISQSAMNVAEAWGIPYCRYERPQLAYPVPAELQHLVHYIPDLATAAVQAALLGNTIFCTIGSKHLPELLNHQALLQKRVIARILPDLQVLQQLQACGLRTQDLIAMQGPFSTALNQAMFAQTKADVVISKESGVSGGLNTKIEAALNLGLPILILQRPQLNYRNQYVNYQELFEFTQRSVF